ncbi:MAG: hypothetical protein GYB33_13810 [Gammaproteobacteria bacterium]|nr:hypothetical protein [Gammaproteobacteria bacterium]
MESTAINCTHERDQIAAFRDKGVWIFVGIDLVVFALFFLVFLVERSAAVAVFQQSQQQLNEHIGFANTLILITSSWLLVKSIRSMLVNQKLGRFYLLASMLMGMLFVFSKLFEYKAKFDAGIGIVDNTFYTFYFVLTFIHFCHVVGGLIALNIIYGCLKRPATVPVKSEAESVAIYWHMVDLLWVFLFLILYLLN